jgi:hypothetical protein
MSICECFDLFGIRNVERIQTKKHLISGQVAKLALLIAIQPRYVSLVPKHINLCYEYECHEP